MENRVDNIKSAGFKCARVGKLLFFCLIVTTSLTIEPEFEVRDGFSQSPVFTGTTIKCRHITSVPLFAP
jgi:hypothetical protein